MKTGRLNQDYREVNVQRIRLLDDNDSLQKRFTEIEKQRYQLEQLLQEKNKHLETTLIILNNTKIKLEIVQKQLNDIQTENSKLSIRGAASFLELTPRYDKFKEVFEEFKIPIGTENGSSQSDRRKSIKDIPRFSKASDEEYVKILKMEAFDLKSQASLLEGIIFP